MLSAGAHSYQAMREREAQLADEEASYASTVKLQTAYRRWATQRLFRAMKHAVRPLCSLCPLFLPRLVGTG